MIKPLAIAAGLYAAGLSGAGHAATLTDSLFAFQAGSKGLNLAPTVTTGLFDPNALFLPTTSTIPLAKGGSLAVSTIVQVQQPQNGFPYLLSDGFMGDLFQPQDANGNGVQTETITPSAGTMALGFEVVPYSQKQPGFAYPGAIPFPGGPYAITVALNGQSITDLLPGGDLNTGATVPQFFGFYGGPIASLTISTNDPNGFAFGNFNPVPEPASLALLAVGAAGMAGLRRRRPPFRRP